MATAKEQLSQIRELIKAGKKPQAVSRLARMIERQPRNAELWWLLANATDDIDQARRALEELLSLQPDDQRAKTMLERLDARALLNQMGVNRQPTGARARGNRRVMFFVVFVLIFGLIVAGVLVGSNMNNNAETAIAEQPTLFMLPTETDTPAPTETPMATETPTPEPTETLVAPTLDFRLPSDLGGGMSPDVTAEVIAPETTAEARAPETTAEALPPQPGTTQAVPPPILAPVIGTPAPPPIFGTQEIGVPPIDGFADVSAAPTEVPYLLRGFVVEARPVQELIQPYDLHGWEFSGRRDETITLELVNISGDGNVSLLILNDLKQVIYEDTDLVSGNRREVRTTLQMPADGTYYAVVRMIAVKEQLYYLSIRRG